MKRNRIIVENEKPEKRAKLQQTITSMFHAGGPKFVEAAGVQLVCPYCHHKFRAPQGLISHKHMHERAGDNKFFKRLSTSAEPPAKVQNLHSRPERERSTPKDQDSTQEQEESQKIISSEIEVIRGRPHQMTRRFTVAEKLQILDKYAELQIISSTCR